MTTAISSTSCRRDGHFSHYHTTGDFLNGIDIWDDRMPIRAHAIAGQLSGAMKGTQPSADETRPLAWLEANLAGEFMIGGYSLSGVHEPEQAETYATQRGILKDANVAGSNVTAQPNWKKLPEIDSKDSSIAVRFHADHGVTVALDAETSMSDALCDKFEAELKPIVAFFNAFSWTKDDQINQTLQRNLNLVKAARGQNPSITTVTYAADGTVQRTTTSGRTAWNRNLLTAVLCTIAGLAIGLPWGSSCRRAGERIGFRQNPVNWIDEDFDRDPNVHKGRRWWVRNPRGALQRRVSQDARRTGCDTDDLPVKRSARRRCHLMRALPCIC